MKITIDMPVVSECTVTDCAYNVNAACHARAITIGDGLHPGCDTFLGGASSHTKSGRTAGVGACKVIGCTHNDDFECMAPRVTVGFKGNSVDCLTFASR